MSNVNEAGIKNLGDNGPDGLALNGRILQTSIETIAAGGTTTVVDRDFSISLIDSDAGGDIFTLADGDNGETHGFFQLSSTGISTITPANFAGGTSVTMAAIGASVSFRFVSGSWYVESGHLFTIVA